jgi:hypothetical protein
MKSYLFVLAPLHVLHQSVGFASDATNFQTANHRIMLNPYASITKIDFSHSECVLQWLTRS